VVEDNQLVAMELDHTKDSLVAAEVAEGNHHIEVVVEARLAVARVLWEGVLWVLVLVLELELEFLQVQSFFFRFQHRSSSTIKFNLKANIASDFLEIVFINQLNFKWLASVS